MLMPDAAEELLTAEEAAARLNVTRSYLYRLIKRGVVPEAVGIRNGREVKLIPASALARLNAHEGLLVRDVGAPTPEPVSDRPATGSVTPARAGEGEPPDTMPYELLLDDLRAELRLLREQLTQEREARRSLEAQLTKAPVRDAGEDVALAISRANEVTALVKASEVKQNRILEELLSERRWGRARKIAYAAYLALATLASIAAILFVLQLANHLQAMTAR
jgi:excisionase family DNA binding protein